MSVESFSPAESVHYFRMGRSGWIGAGSPAILSEPLQAAYNSILSNPLTASSRDRPPIVLTQHVRRFFLRAAYVSSRTYSNHDLASNKSIWQKEEECTRARAQEREREREVGIVLSPGKIEFYIAAKASTILIELGEEAALCRSPSVWLNNRARSFNLFRISWLSLWYTR